MFKGKIRNVALSLFATAVVGSAVADMVYDDEKTMSAAPTQVEVKNVINNSGDAAPIATTPPVVVQSEKIQKVSEKSREKRGFQESMNNELVIQKLEENRLKREEKLTAEINKRFTLEEDAPAGTAAPIMKEQAVVKPITDAPVAAGASYEMSAAPKTETVAAKPIVQDQVSVSQSSTNMSVAPLAGKPEGEKAVKSGISITPKAGFSTISNSAYEITSKYALGVGLGFDVSDNVGVELGYSYGENALKLNYVPGAYGPYYSPYTSARELVYKSNTFDLGMKLYLSGLDAKVRPFVGAGVAYTVGFVNYDSRSIQELQAYGANLRTTDYQLTQFQGALQAGLELKIASNVSIGATYKLLKPLSSNESDEGLQAGGFYGAPNVAAVANYDKQALRGTIRDSAIQMFLVGASIQF